MKIREKIGLNFTTIAEYLTAGSMKFKTKKAPNYTSIAVNFTTALMFISAFIAVMIIITFFYRLISKDYTTTNVRQMQVELVPDYDKLKNADKYDGSTKTNYAPSKIQFEKNAFMWNQSGEFIVYNAPLPLFIFVHYWDACFFALLFWTFYLIRKFLLSMEYGRTFTPENIKLLEKISMIIIWTPPIDVFVQSYVLNSFLKPVKFVENMIVRYSFHIVPYITILFFGFLLFAMIKAFEKGMILKEENDLTV